jgi:hypothetical protein
LVLALGISIGATFVGFDRERSFYPMVMIVIAALYLLFASMAGSTQALLQKMLPSALFIVAAVTGFRKTLCGWWQRLLGMACLVPCMGTSSRIPAFRRGGLVFV